MGDELRQRRLRLQEKKKAAEFEERLGSLVCYDYVARDEIPPWVHAEIKRFLRMGSDPDSRISKHSDVTDFRPWIGSFIERSGVGSRFYLLTSFNFRPWLDCEIRSQDWLDNVLDEFGPTVSIILIANDFSVVVAVFEEEHEFIAFTAHRQ